MTLTALLLFLSVRQGAVAAQSNAPPTDGIAALPIAAEKKWALCVGAEKYQSLAPLEFAVNDAKAFARTLREGYGFEPSTVDLVADGEPKVPNSATILGELDRLLADRRLDRGDLFVFYFSGHGIGTLKGDYLMPTDVSESEAEQRGIPVRDIIERFVKRGLKNVLVVADACRSGKANPFGRELQELGRRANIAVLLGCQPGQRSYEYPRLGNGVFTHFLVRNMTDRSLTDRVSGALWASAVAQKTARNVREYTESDYGEDAQNPAVWTEATQDVLMAAYPPQGEEAKGWLETAMKLEGGKLPPTAYGRFLSQVGQTLAGRGRNEEAISALKTLDGLGLSTWRDLLALTFSLHNESRESEIGALVDRAIREPAPTDHTEGVILLGRPSYVGAARYRQALDTVSRPETYGFTGATLLAALANGRLEWTDAQTGKELARYLPYVPSGSPEAHYIAAYVALGEARYAEAVAEAKAAVDGATDAESKQTIRDEMRGVRLRAADGTKDAAAAEAVLLEGAADPRSKAPWAILRLRRMEERKDPGLPSAVRAFAAGNDDPARLGEAITLLGSEAGVLLKDAQRIAARFPVSWRAAVNVWLTEIAADGFKDVPPLPETAIKYAPDGAMLSLKSLFVMDQMIEGAREAHRLNGWRAAALRSDLVDQYASFRKDVGNDPIALAAMAHALLGTTETVHQYVFLHDVLGPRAEKSVYARQELATYSLLLAITACEEAVASRIFETLRTEGLLLRGPAMRYALHAALREDAREAERALKIWEALPGGQPNAREREYAVAVRALLAAQMGDKDRVAELLKTVTQADEISGPVSYLAILVARDGKNPGKETMAALEDPWVDYSDLQVATLLTIFRGAESDRSPTGRKTLGMLSHILTLYAGHPWLYETGFAGTSELAAYAGTSVWKGVGRNGLGDEPITLKITVDESGKATGDVDLPNGGYRLEFTGTIDRFGNAILMLTNEKRQSVGRIYARLPIHGFERDWPELKTKSLRFEMINHAWNALHLDLKLAESSPPATKGTAAPGSVATRGSHR